MDQSELHTKEMTTAGLNLIAQALSIYDADLRLVVCNLPFQTMFDLPDRLVSPGASFQETIRHLASCGEYGEVQDIEAFLIERVEQARAFKPHYMERTRSNGRRISVEGSPLPQGGWVTVYTDITRTKQQEDLLRARSDALSDQLGQHTQELSARNRELAATITQLEETKRQLTESEARTRLTTEMMPAHIAHADAEGRYTFSNRRLSAILPGLPSEIVGLQMRDALGEANFARLRESLERAYNGEGTVCVFTDETNARRIRAAFTPDTRGGVYILTTDITEETRTREALHQTRRRELAAQMISGMAHDFSNLLTIILGLQSRLSRLDELPEDAHALIDGTLAAARRGGTLLGSIADATSPRSLRPIATSLAGLNRDLATLANPTLPAGVALKTLGPTEDLAVLLDPGLVQDGLLNLILNARDACGGAGEITLVCRCVGETWIEWRVEDNGPGFSERALKHGLDPFFTTKGSEGTGLGLPMVYDLAKRAGGTLHIRNTEVGGCAILRVPYRPAVPATTGLALLVEDRDDLRTLYRDMLMKLGHSVIEAVTVEEATALIADLPDISLVLSDIQLQGDATGLELARRVGPNLPLVLMTSLPAEHPLHVEAQTLAPVLQKPFEASALTDLMAGAKAAQ